MILTHRQLEITTRIDQDVQKVGQKAKTLEAGEEAVIELMPKYIHEFKHNAEFPIMPPSRLADDVTIEKY